MQSGVLEQWLLNQGDPIKMYDVVCNVSTDQLTESRTDPRYTLEIEVHEDGYLARILVPAGSHAAPDEPIAILCEQREDVAAFDDLTLFPRDLVSPGTFFWQAYVKEGEVRECGKGASEASGQPDYWLGHRADD